jgi:RNA polymerase sigma factor (sigma-70 family)
MDHSVFSQTYKTHVQSLYSYGIGLGYPHEICLDAIQDVFCKLYTQNLLADINNIKYYLFRSLKNRLIDIRKSTKKEINQLNENEEFSIEVSIMDHILISEEEILLKNKVESLLKLLTDRQREAIYLRYMQELEYEEIGRLLDMNAESVRKLVHRGIDKIRKNTDPNTFLLVLIFLMKYFLKY